MVRVPVPLEMSPRHIATPSMNDVQHVLFGKAGKVLVLADDHTQVVIKYGL